MQFLFAALQDVEFGNGFLDEQAGSLGVRVLILEVWAVRSHTLVVILCVLALAALAASCGRNTLSKQSPGPQTVFFDDFSGGFPGTNWTVGAGSPAIDPDIGNGPPSLMFPALDATGYSWIQSKVPAFSTTLGITISADMGFPTGLPVWSQFWVYDQYPGLGGGPQAYVFLDQTAGTVTYHLATGVNPEVTVVNPLDADTKFHTYTFQVDASGNASWSRDGVQQASTTGFSCATLLLMFEGGWTGETYVDNVSVVVP